MLNNFLVNISSSGVDIFVKSKDNPSKKYFELSSNSYSDKYRCNCNSSNFISTIKNREDAIFRKIFVKISDCPYWSQERL